MAGVIDRFFEEEADEHVRRLLVEELSSRSTGSRYFTFDVFNVRLDFNERVATIEDELDAAVSESLSLDDLRERLSG